MATNKHATIRYQALDKCFRNTGRKYFIDDLIEACNKTIYNYSGISDGVKRRQIFDDINFMQSESGWTVPLERLKDGRRVYYRYSDTSFSINNQPLNEAEANQLKEAMLTLNRFKGMPQFEWVDEMITRLEDSFDFVDSENKIIEFEQNQFLKGLEHVSIFYHSIVYKKVLQIKYQSFKQSEPNIITFYPHYLKQYNSRWFVFGYQDKYETISNLALDRIEKISETDNEFRDSEIDYSEYFEDIIGVTIPKDSKAETITLKVKDSLLPYILSKPIHGSQKVNGNTLELNLIVNYEFISLLLSYGENIEVLEPFELKDKINTKIDEMKRNYF